MDLRIYMILFIFGIPVVTSVDFTQFYLPQCCYVPNPAASEQTPAYARHDFHIKRPGPSDPESDSEETQTQIKSKIDTNTPPSSSSSKPKSERKVTARLYRYIIPMKETAKVYAGDSSEETSKEDLPKPPRGMREGGNPMRKSLQKSMKVESLLSRSAEQFLSQPEIEPLLAPSNLTANVPSVESLLFNNKTLETMLVKHKRNTARSTTESPLQKDSKELQSFNSNRKMPSTWIINLRRALYQSMDSLISAQRKQPGSTNNNDETIEAKSSNINPSARSSNEVYQTKVTELWEKLRGANLTLVEPLSRSATELPDTVYLPAGEGPIASGVVVNTVNGLQLRMASELYFQQDEPDRDPSAASDNNCNCHLINNGEMLMAYWAVSRIASENGQPALQYLIYPLPHNVPTPPRMIPFNQYSFNPAVPYNNANVAAAAAGNRKVSKAQRQQQQLAKQQAAQHHLAQGQEQVVLQPQHHHPRGQLGRVKQLAGGLPGDAYEAIIPQLQEIPIDPSQLTRPALPQQPSIPSQFQNVFDGFNYFTQIPQLSPQVVDDRNGYRGILIQNQHGYTPEFVDVYKQAVSHHLNQQQGPGIPQLVPQVVTQKQTHGNPPPAHVQLFDGKSSGFPKSIQDILNPTQQQPQLQQQVLPGQLPAGLIPGQVQSVGGFEHIPAAGPPVSQEYVGVLQNYQQHGLEQPGGGGIAGQKLSDVVNYYSFDHNPPTGKIPYDSTKDDHHPNQDLQPDPYLGDDGFRGVGGLDGDLFSPVYPERPHSYSSVGSHRQPHSLGGNSFASGSINDEYRRPQQHYRHQPPPQQLPPPTRHRPEKYPRPPPASISKQFNSDGSYIINF